MKIVTLTSQLPTFDLNKKRVLLRADLNIPLKDGTITHDHRLKALTPTLDLIQKKGGKIILATHIGRPRNANPALSTKNLIPWFKSNNYSIKHEPDLTKAYTKSFDDFATILLLENMRFFPGEKNADPDFARALAQLGDYYVNDAFALAHRNDTSVTLVPQLFPSDKRTVGLLVEHELEELNTFITSKQQPFVVVIGGGKAADKLPLLYNLIDQVDTILLCPAIVFTFLKAQGIPVGKSLVDDSALSLCNALLKKAQQHNVKIVFPVDYQIAHNSIEGPLSYVSGDTISKNDIGISVGPKTIELFLPYIQEAQKNIF